ncbi:5'/3'-nucleotidase SurE [Algicella marina]|uniref:5'-nucleotidase SurE n=1 Tax=Algicella marina TaxID=2683284 RepID=A0A6P1SYT7_9RHOB|nr:5'/3'-nucleotidase SurE [Algicella marina]QHQ34695.1 5'/3'-nucleotidase SurE [Algicella marina]
MRILVTNDDGINAPGLAVAEAIAAAIAGPDGEVWVVAPAFEQSGVSHAISFVRPMRIERFGTHRFAVEGSPADCVLAGLGDVMADCPPDLVLSGVNKGHNVAEDTLYSGTVGAAMEAAMHGHKAIAMSQYFGPDNRGAPDEFLAARNLATGIIGNLLAKAAWADNRYGVFYNINFPPVGDMADVKGCKATFQGHRPEPSFGVIPQEAPNMRRYLWLGHGKGNAQTEPGSDSRECLNGYATVTPLRADLTARDALPALEAALGD